MSDLSKDVPLSDELVNGANANTSQRAMLITMILLVSGLLLTSTMMLYHSNKQNTAPTKANTDHETPKELGLKTASFIKGFRRKVSKEESESIPDANLRAGVMDQFFGNRNNSARWPKLKLTGFGTSTDGSGGFAIINNHKYKIGERINGKVTLLDIRKHNVLVEWSGETKILTVDTAD